MQEVTAAAAASTSTADKFVRDSVSLSTHQGEN